MSESIRTRQNPLFVETLEEAVEATAAACGGKKEFACVLRPDLKEDPAAAHRWLLDALNTDRRTELHAIHLVRACKEGQRNNCHILKHWLDETTGYEKTQPAASKSRRQVLLERRAALAQEDVDIERELEEIKQQEANPDAPLRSVR